MCIYDVYGPCSCPHGRCFTALAQCFTISSWVCSLMAITSCFYMYVRPIPEEGQPELPREGFGYISKQVGVMQPPAYRQCVWYDKAEKDEMFDGMWNAGKAMSLLAVGVGGIVMCIVMCTCCVAFELPTFDGLFWTCMFCFVAQALTFLSWGSSMCDEYECTWSSGTGMNITAAMLWVWAANMIKSFPEALPPRTRRNNNEDDPSNRYGGRRLGRKPRGGGEDYDDDDMDYEDSPYLASNRSGFQDEYGDDDGDYYGDGDEYDDQYRDDEDGYNNNSYYNDGEDGDWHNDDGNDDGRQQQGYYDDDGNWYEEDGNGRHPSQGYGGDDDDDNDGNWEEDEGYNEDGQNRQPAPRGPGGKDVIRDSQRTINQLD